MYFIFLYLLYICLRKPNFIPGTTLHTWGRCFVIDGPVIVPDLSIILAYPER